MKNKKNFLLIILIFFLTACSLKVNDKKDLTTFKYYQILNQTTSTAKVSEYTIYGRFLNIKGSLDLKVDNLQLVLKNNQEELSYNLEITVKNNQTFFKLSNLINKGINLDNINIGEYLILLKTINSNQINYYTLENKTSYLDLDYYSTTKNKTNKKITLNFSNYQDTNYLLLECQITKLPADIYDIVIDPGHGGKDVGASKNGKFESQINLDYALSLKSALTNLGLKVKLTRDDDINIPIYGKNGRVSIPYQARAKLLLSIHQNSSIKNVNNGGVEVYIANNSNYQLAKDIVTNIKNLTSSQASKNVSNKVAEGVYLRTLSQTDLDNIKKEAIEKGYLPYEKATLNSTYYYIIRETGGIITGSYIDSRSKEDYNNYYNSNFGVEAYLLELGYINSAYNLNLLLTQKDKYIQAITQAVSLYLEI